MDCRTWEIQVQFLNDRINGTEKHLLDVCHCLSLYTHKLAKARDAGDKLVQALQRFAQSERLNTTLQAAIFSVAEHLASIQDHKDMQVRRIEAKAVKKLSDFGTIIKQAKDDLRKCSEARTNELTKRQQEDRLRGRYPANWQIPAGFLKGSPIPDPLVVTAESKMDLFEQQRVGNVCQVLSDLLNVELLFHAKAVELFANAVQAISTVDQEKDLKTFRSCLSAPLLHQRNSSLFHSAPNLPTLNSSPEESISRRTTFPSRRSLPDKESAVGSDDSDVTYSEDESGLETIHSLSINRDHNTNKDRSLSSGTRQGHHPL